MGTRTRSARSGWGGPGLGVCVGEHCDSIHCSLTVVAGHRTRSLLADPAEHGDNCLFRDNDTNHGAREGDPVSCRPDVHSGIVHWRQLIPQQSTATESSNPSHYFRLWFPLFFALPSLPLPLPIQWLSFLHFDPKTACCYFCFSSHTHTHNLLHILFSRRLFGSAVSETKQI